MNEKIKKNVKEENFNVAKTINKSQETKEDLEIGLDQNPTNKDLKTEETEFTNNSIEENLREEITQLKDEKLRLLAEMENLRKRSDRDRVDSIKFGSINFARDILSPDDNLTRALEAISEEEKKSETIANLIDGLKMVQKEFSTILQKHGVKKIDALNQKFDHNLHQAMVEIDNEKVEEGLVIQEIQSGYTMYERLLRPSMVGVSKKPTKDMKDEEKK